MRSICLALCGVALVLVPAAAQDPDALAQEFIDFGIRPGHWNPGHAFPDCQAEPWAMEAVRTIASADLSLVRRYELGMALAEKFALCGIPELEEWYFAEMIRLADNPTRYPSPFWDGMGLADNPRVRAKLYEWLSSDVLPTWFREQAAGVYFAKFEGTERLTALAGAFEQGHVPSEFAGIAISRLVHAHPEATVTRLGRLAREQPGRFLNDPAFAVLLIPDVMRKVPPAARTRFLDDVRTGMRSPAISPHQRRTLEEAVDRIERLGSRR